MLEVRNLTKGQIRKRNALRKSIGDELGEDAFQKWLKQQPAKGSSEGNDPIADRLVAALSGLADDKTFRLGRKGYVVRRAKGKGAKGFVAEKLD